MNLIKIHPAVYIIYYVLWLVFLFLFNNPYYIIVSYIAILSLITIQEIRSEFKNTIKFVIPMAVLIFILNPIIYHEGVHRIYIMGSYFITLESTFYGCIMCATLILVLLLFASYNRAVSYQEMLYIFSKKFSNLSMVMVMALRFIPLINFRAIEIRDINKVSINYETTGDCDNERFTFSSLENSESLSLKNGLSNLESRNGLENNSKSYSLKSRFNSLKYKVKNTAYIFGIIISWSLEDSMLTAKSMKSRAFGVAKRTNYLNFKFNLIDYVLLTLMIVISLIEIVGLFYGYGRINIYPMINFSFSDLPLNIFFFAWFVFLFLLISLEIYEKFLWYKHNKKKLSRYSLNISNEIATSNLSNLQDGSENMINQTEIYFDIEFSNLNKLDFTEEKI